MLLSSEGHVYSKTLHCSRCKGRGLRDCARMHHGVPGLCFDCNGSGLKADQAATKAAAKEAARLWKIYTEAQDKIYAVREANGGSKLPPRERRSPARDRFAGVRGFGTQDYADAFSMTKAEAWVELCRWTEVYPHQIGDAIVGWTFMH